MGPASPPAFNFKERCEGLQDATGNSGPSTILGGTNLCVKGRHTSSLSSSFVSAYDNTPSSVMMMNGSNTMMAGTHQQHSPAREAGNGGATSVSGAHTRARTSSALNLVFLGILCFAVAILMRTFPALTYAQRSLVQVYFQPFVPLALMLALWAAAVAAWDGADVPWRACFDLSTRRAHMSATDAWTLAVGLAAAVAASAAAFSHATLVKTAHVHALKAGTPERFAPPLLSPTAIVVALYLGVLAFVVWPQNVFNAAARKHFATTVARVFVAPMWCPRVNFSDFLFADVLTSLAKSLADVERAVCHLVVTDSSDPLSKGMPVCGNASWSVPFALALPSLIRFAQCLRAHRDAAHARGVTTMYMSLDLWNALKYLTALPVICLSYLNHHVDAEEWVSTWRPLWLLAAVVNTTYSVYWDVTRDWELGAIHRVIDSRRQLLRHDLLYSREFYYYLIASNTAMRFAWSYKLSSHLRSRVAANLVAACVEAVRRFQWIFVRVEVEIRKIANGERKLVHERVELAEAVNAAV